MDNTKHNQTIERWREELIKQITLTNRGDVFIGIISLFDIVSLMFFMAEWVSSLFRALGIIMPIIGIFAIIFGLIKKKKKKTAVLNDQQLDHIQYELYKMIDSNKKKYKRMLRRGVFGVLIWVAVLAIVLAIDNFFSSYALAIDNFLSSYMSYSARLWFWIFVSSEIVLFVCNIIIGAHSLRKTKKQEATAKTLPTAEEQIKRSYRYQ